MTNFVIGLFKHKEYIYIIPKQFESIELESRGGINLFIYIMHLYNVRYFCIVINQFLGTLDKLTLEGWRL